MTINSSYKLIAKNCKECNLQLTLICKRDIERKNFCSKSCRAAFYGKQQDLSALWILANTEESNAKKGHKKEKHHNWIFDRTKVKSRIRPENNEWRNSVFNRDKFLCQECGQKGGVLHAHHKAPYSKFPMLRYVLENGLTVCYSCHQKIHQSVAEIFGGLNKKDKATICQ